MNMQQLNNIINNNAFVFGCELLPALILLIIANLLISLLLIDLLLIIERCSMRLT
ncbi:MAG: hypothetical protein IJC21_08295 [Lentisphaeria bacterium]|nr:hypothetical protein [Lentisphaeria bacterium]